MQTNNPVERSPTLISTKPEQNGSEKISPVFFRKQADLQMYACHHFPAAKSTKSEAVLICNATAHEYERCHRAMRQLAIQLARGGRHTMRFDYSGTGDSAGDYTQSSMTQWRQDITDAVDECQRQSGKTKTCIIGIRLGATLAAQVAAKMNNVENLILYAPVTNANKLLAEWQKEQAKHDSLVNRNKQTDSQLEVLGFPLTKSFCSELENLTELTAPGTSLRNVLILTDNESDTEDSDIKQMAKTLGSQGATVTVIPADADAIWRQDVDTAMVPFKLLRRMVSWLNES